jgi:hypothetical protein
MLTRPFHKAPQTKDLANHKVFGVRALQVLESAGLPGGEQAFFSDSIRGRVGPPKDAGSRAGLPQFSLPKSLSCCKTTVGHEITDNNPGGSGGSRELAKVGWRSGDVGIGVDAEEV